MISRHKIFILPLIIVLLAFYSQLKDYPLKTKNVSLKAHTHFPVQPESKTQLTKPNWFKKFYRSLSPVIECKTEIKFYDPKQFVNISIHAESIVTPECYLSLKGRSPPLFS